jgi:hypothetical protein
MNQKDGKHRKTEEIQNISANQKCSKYCKQFSSNLTTAAVSTLSIPSNQYSKQTEFGTKKLQE